ncbi:NAD(P)-binding domain-containing protein [Rhodococcus sp. BP-252]|uniref:NAD(P)-binding domain-containing protein n=1 Tax=unclassified Rhodococcus (in: high G+C Gram-positive bacteria) TaxID=192944 RepID=UPI001DDA1204|nr:NAD(P)-binding domain-containing protein [Rhodococcus sp. BP-320]MBY6419500.1 NAD(P)-binding domain-containing protein [Rhodococcus sp. BP-321]MBY6424488.1 NAD(P)-binding domain-containing protein [Rhodococcus sp. BP-324]MBY6429511.1 NAD(P)-binding domain-containing protein [Rhodococcus sp. BP-323]MBY6434498.1 NAD(P)-binding domain-containing protein [Rhodococcus sp. BP-322]MBY6443341.1 NAD(P)-binding domain-containing protein [Rhodococcus sp. BP-319]MBY6448166.1 NAD(P)-binding domain-cont
MRVAVIGLGKMGFGMRDRLRSSGHEVIGFDHRAEVSDSATLAEAVSALGEGTRVVWVMVPAGDPTHAVIAELSKILSAGDIVVEGGISRFTSDHFHADVLAER